MNFVLVLVVLIASITGTNAQIQTMVALPDSTVQQQRLDAVATEFASLTNSVKRPLLNNADKTSYLRFLHACASKQKQLGQAIATNADCNYDRQLGLMEQFVEYIKKAHLKLELVTVGLDTNSHAFLDKPLEQRVYNQALATIHQELYLWLACAWKSMNTSTLSSLGELSNQHITEIVTQTLPEEFRLPALGIDLYDDNSLLVDEYFACMEQCQNCKYAYDTKTYVALVSRLDGLIASFEEIQSELLDFFITKLFCTRQAIAFSAQLQDVNNLHSALISVFMKHHRLIQSNKFTTTYSKLSHADREYLDGYIVLIEHFFSTPSFQSLLFVNDIEAMISEFSRLIALVKKAKTPKTDKPASWFAFMEKGEHLMDRAEDLMERNETVMEKFQNIVREFFGRCEGLLGSKKTPTEHVMITCQNQHLLEEMLDVLISIHTHITQKPEETESSWSELVAYVRSGTWFTGNAIQNDEGNIALELASQALDSAKFTDAKSAAKQALIYASPFLFAKIVEYLRTRISTKLEPQLDGLTDHKGNGALANNDKIIDFAKNNPDVLKQLTQEHPEILDLLAESLKDLARKSG